LLWGPASSTFAEPGQSKLTQSDREYLDSLFREFLFDPIGAERVRVKVPDPRFGAWSEAELTARDGWLVKGTKGEPDRVFFMDGYGITAPRADRIERVDFLAPIERFFKTRQPPEADTGEWVQKTAKQVLGGTDCFLPFAAWLYRLGHDDYAAQALGLARALARNDPKDDLREDLSRTSFDAMHDAFRARADAEALARAEYFVRVFAAKEEKRKIHAKAIVADLERRRKKGVFGTIPSKDWPPGFSKWALTNKLDYLIDALENAAEWQFDNPGVIRNRVITSFGEPPFTDDRIVAALIELGEPAVPSLIGVIEKDTRLTRWPVRQYKFGYTGEFHGVADAAEVAVKSILRVKRLPEVVMEAQAPSIPDLRAVAIRSYWEKYGKLPFDARMMTILTDRDGSEYSWREAAENFASLDYDRRFGVSDPWNRRSPPDPRKPNPYVPKFTNPTVAEAIVAAMDRDRARQQGRRPQNDAFHEWPRTEQEYLDYLVELGDRRIGPELDHRAANAEDNDVRRKHAFAAYRLGASDAWKAYAKDVEMGSIPLPHKSTSIWDIEPPATDDVGRMVTVLAQSRSTEGDRALFALSNPKHPYYAAVYDGLVVRARYGDLYFPWRSHRYCLAILRRGLNDATLTDGRYAIVDDSVQGTGNGWSFSSSGIPTELQDPKSRREKAEARLCDIAAMSLGEIVAGIPFYHVLLAEPEQGVRRIKEFLNLYRDRFREMNPEEQERFGIRFMRNAYIPDIKALGRPATTHDVKAGTAIFELDGQGRIADGDQSGWLQLKSEARKEYPEVGLVVQCEVGPDGKRVYGVIFRHSVRAVKADEVERIEPYAKKIDLLDYRFTFFGFAR